MNYILTRSSCGAQYKYIEYRWSGSRSRNYYGNSVYDLLKGTGNILVYRTTNDKREWMVERMEGKNHPRFNVNEMILIHRIFPLWNVILVVVVVVVVGKTSNNIKYEFPGLKCVRSRRKILMKWKFYSYFNRKPFKSINSHFYAHFQSGFESFFDVTAISTSFCVEWVIDKQTSKQ